MRVVIVGGAGLVGSGTAFAVALTVPGVREIVLVDEWVAGAAAHALDMQQLGATVRPVDIAVGGPDEVTSADVVVLAASAPRPETPERGGSFERNLAVLSDLVPALQRVPEHAVILLATNPVDPLCTWLQRATGLERGRILGYSTNDSARFRLAVARVLEVAPDRVEGWVLGQHGQLQVPLYSRLRVDGEPMGLSPEQRNQVNDEIFGWFANFQALRSGRSSQWASGQGLAAMVDAIGTDAGSTWPAALVLDGEYDLHEVAVAVPVQLGTGGATVEQWELDDEELEGLHRAADAVRRSLVGSLAR